jgi:hypothetical protein
MYQSIQSGNPIPFQVEFPEFTLFSENMMDILVESMYQDESRLQLLKSLRRQASFARNIEKASQLSSEIDLIISRYRATADRVSRLYRQDLDDLNSALLEYPLLSLSTDRKIHQNDERLISVVKYKKNLEKLTAFTQEFAKTIEETLSSDEKPYLGALSRFYVYGFSERAVLKLLERATNTD